MIHLIVPVSINNFSFLNPGYFKALASMASNILELIISKTCRHLKFDNLINKERSFEAL